MRVALVHDWLVRMRGGEKVLEALCELFPDSDLYTLIYRKGHISDTIRNRRIKSSILSSLPCVNRWYPWLLPIFPFAIEGFDLKGYDLVISTSHCVAKGVRMEKNTCHICYCFTPMRYLWGFEQEYFGNKGWLFKKSAIPLMRYLKRWDLESNKGVDCFIAISNNIREKVARSYGRDSEVIYPPVDTSYFRPDSANRGDYFLIVSALVPYKRIDIAVDAFNRLNLPLVIIGEGPCEKELKSRSLPNITFMKWQSQSDLFKFYNGCKALIFPGEEDFGIVPLESQACGRPVIAYKKGGALETVVEGKTGLFFYPQSPSGLIDAVQRFDPGNFSRDEIRRHAVQFDKELFKAKFKELVNRLSSGRRRDASNY